MHCLMVVPMHPSSMVNTVWESLFLLPALLYTATIMPYALCFALDGTSEVLDGVDIFFWIVFIVDMLVTLNTAIVDKRTGEQQFSRKIVTLAYLKSWLVVDLVSIIPWSTMLGESHDVGGSERFARLSRLPRALRLLRLLKLTRVSQLPLVRVIYRNMQDSFVSLPAFASVLSTLFFSLLVVHWTACIWHFIGTSNSSDGTLAGLDQENWLVYFDYQYGTSNWRRYVVSIEFVLATLTSVGYGNMYAISNGEKMYTSLLMCVGLIGSAVITSNILAVVASLHTQSASSRARREGVLQLIRTAAPPRDIRRKLMVWVESTNRSAAEISDVMPLLPAPLRKEILLHIHKPLTSKVHMLDAILKEVGGSDVVAEIVWRLKKITLPAGSTLYLEGTPVDGMYFVHTGRFELLQDGEVQCVEGTGGMFGEVETLFFNHYQFSAIAAGPLCEVAYLSRKHVRSLSQAYSELFGDPLRLIALDRMAELDLDPDMSGVPDGESWHHDEHDAYPDHSERAQSVSSSEGALASPRMSKLPDAAHVRDVSRITDLDTSASQQLNDGPGTDASSAQDQSATHNPLKAVSNELAGSRSGGYQAAGPSESRQSSRLRGLDQFTQRYSRRSLSHPAPLHLAGASSSGSAASPMTSGSKPASNRGFTLEQMRAGRARRRSKAGDSLRGSQELTVDTHGTASSSPLACTSTTGEDHGDEPAIERHDSAAGPSTTTRRKYTTLKISAAARRASVVVPKGSVPGSGGHAPHEVSHSEPADDSQQVGAIHEAPSREARSSGAGVPELGGAGPPSSPRRSSVTRIAQRSNQSRKRNFALRARASIAMGQHTALLAELARDKAAQATRRSEAAPRLRAVASPALPRGHSGTRFLDTQHGPPLVEGSEESASSAESSSRRSGARASAASDQSSSDSTATLPDDSHSSRPSGVAAMLSSRAAPQAPPRQTEPPPPPPRPASSP